MIFAIVSAIWKFEANKIESLSSPNEDELNAIVRTRVLVKYISGPKLNNRELIS